MFGLVISKKLIKQAVTAVGTLGLTVSQMCLPSKAIKIIMSFNFMIARWMATACFCHVESIDGHRLSALADRLLWVRLGRGKV